MNERIFLVDEQDRVIGFSDKMTAHREKLRHRAFSIFLYAVNTERFLLQKRAKGKYHSGGLWTNACCSHPREGEKIEDCLKQRLYEELGLKTDFQIADPCATFAERRDLIYPCGIFSYFTDFGDVAENEIDHVFLYYLSEQTDFACNKDEIEALRWVTVEELHSWMAQEPQAFTAWFPPALELVLSHLEKRGNNRK